MTASTAENGLSSSFLLLPAEIRNQIYIYVFSDRTYQWSKLISVTRRNRDSDVYSFIPRFAPPVWLGLIRTCWQINDETCLLPYLLNKFRVSYPPIFHQLLDHLRRSRQPLTSLRLELEAMVVSQECIFGNIFSLALVACFSPNVTHIEVTVIGLRQWENWYCKIRAVRDPEYHTLHRSIEDALTVGSNGNIKVTILWDHGGET
jgi:hypothetical protein